jgi:hypothetical protein
LKANLLELQTAPPRRERQDGTTGSRFREAGGKQPVLFFAG